MKYIFTFLIMLCTIALQAQELFTPDVIKSHKIKSVTIWQISEQDSCRASYKVYDRLGNLQEVIEHFCPQNIFLSRETFAYNDQNRLIGTQEQYRERLEKVKKYYTSNALIDSLNDSGGKKSVSQKILDPQHKRILKEEFYEKTEDESKYSLKVTCFYTYDDKGRLRMEQEKDETGTVTSEKVYFYNNENLLQKKTTILLGNDQTKQVEEFFYSGDKRLKEKVLYQNGDKITTQFFYKNGLIINEKTLVANELIDQSFYQYSFYE